ncbi:hypothetical protein QQ045_008695 [Rhodiola kirilowii]
MNLLHINPIPSPKTSLQQKRVVLRDQSDFRFTLFYGEPSLSNRITSWSLLRRLGGISNLPWLILGEFNKVISLEEVQGGRSRPNWQMENFRSAMEDYRLLDLGFSGYPYTFSNCREGEAEVKARLDRGWLLWSGGICFQMQ